MVDSQRPLVLPQALAGRSTADRQHLQPAQQTASRRAAGRLLPSGTTDGRVSTTRTTTNPPHPHEPTGQWRCSTSSFPLIDHLMMIAQLAGAAVGLHLHTEAGKSTTIDGRTVTCSVDNWALFFTFTKPARTPMQTTQLAQPVDVTDRPERPRLLPVRRRQASVLHHCTEQQSRGQLQLPHAAFGLQAASRAVASACGRTLSS